MSDTFTADELRARVQGLGVELFDGDAAGYVRFERDLALGSVEIGLDEDDCVYDEAAFPGVVYQPESPPVTIVVSGDGTVAAIDAPDESRAEAAVTAATDTLRELYLVDEPPLESIFPADEIPFAAEPPEVKTLGRGDPPE